MDYKAGHLVIQRGKRERREKLEKAQKEVKVNTKREALLTSYLGHLAAPHGWPLHDFPRLFQPRGSSTQKRNTPSLAVSPSIPTDVESGFVSDALHGLPFVQCHYFSVVFFLSSLFIFFHCA